MPLGVSADDSVLRVDEYIRYLAGTVSVLSIAGALAVGLSYVLFHDCRTFWRRMLLYLSLCDLASAVYVLRFAIEPEVSSDSECQADVAFITFVNTSSFLWSACISFYPLYMLQVSIRKVQNADAHAKVERLLHGIFLALSVGAPALLAVFVAAVYYPAHPLTPASLEGSIGCFIVFDAAAWRLLAVYGPLVVCWVWMLGCYAMGSQKLQERFARAFSRGGPDGDERRLSQSSVGSSAASQVSVAAAAAASVTSRARSLRWKMRMFPLCFVVLRLGEVLFRVLLRIEGTRAAVRHDPGGGYTTFGTLLVYWFAVGAPAQGFANCVLFVFMSPRVRQRYRELLTGRAAAAAPINSPMLSYQPLPGQPPPLSLADPGGVGGVGGVGGLGGLGGEEERLSENSRMI